MSPIDYRDMRVLPSIAIFTLLLLGSLLGQEPERFDDTPFSSFTYEGKRLAEPRIVSVDTNGVTVTDKKGENSITVPLDRALKIADLKMRAKDAIEEASKSCGGTNAPAITLNAEQVSVNAKEVTVNAPNATGSSANTAAAIALKEPLSKTERAQMVRSVVWAKLVKNQMKARELSDQELYTLYQQALPILKLQDIQGTLNNLGY